MRILMRMPKRLAVCVMALCGAGLSKSVDLDNGALEIRGFGGGAIKPRVSPEGTSRFGGSLEIAFGVDRQLALTGEYALSPFGVSECIFGLCTPSQDEKIHEFMGGFRFSEPGSSRITPYFAATIGAVRFVNRGFGAWSNRPEFAIGLGGGLDVRINPRPGFALEPRGIETAAPFPIWIVRPTAGFYFRF
jgi:hypothetical protein